MPKRQTIEKARRDARAGKSASTQAGEFVKEEIDRIRHGEHGARSAKQAIAIGLSEARRAGVKLPAPGKNASSRTKKKAAQDSAAGRKGSHRPSRKRSRATLKALKREPRSSVSHAALSRQAKSAASRRSKSSRSQAARKAAHTRTAKSRKG